MRGLSNLPPGCTHNDIERQCVDEDPEEVILHLKSQIKEALKLCDFADRNWGSIGNGKTHMNFRKRKNILKRQFN